MEALSRWFRRSCVAFLPRVEHMVSVEKQAKDKRSRKRTLVTSSVSSCTFRFFAFLVDPTLLVAFAASTSPDSCMDGGCSKCGVELLFLRFRFFPSLFEDGLDFDRNAGWSSGCEASPRASGVRTKNSFNKSGALRNKWKIWE